MPKMQPPLPLLLDGADHPFEADLYLPENPWGAVIFGGAWRLDPGFVTAMLEALVSSRLAVLAPRFGGLSGQEEPWDSGYQLRQLGAASRWLAHEKWTGGLAQGLFASGPLAAPALRLAAEPPPPLQAVMIFEGSAEMSDVDLEEVRVPTLFVAEGGDPLDAELHEAVAQMLRCESRLILLDQALVPPRAAVGWYVDHFKAYYRGSSPLPYPVRLRGLLSLPMTELAQ